MRIYCRDKWKKFSVHQADAFVLCNEGKNGSALPFFFRKENVQGKKKSLWLYWLFRKNNYEYTSFPESAGV